MLYCIFRFIEVFYSNTVPSCAAQHYSMHVNTVVLSVDWEISGVKNPVK